MKLLPGEGSNEFRIVLSSLTKRCVILEWIEIDPEGQILTAFCFFFFLLGFVHSLTVNDNCQFKKHSQSLILTSHSKITYYKGKEIKQLAEVLKLW